MIVKYINTMDDFMEFLNDHCKLDAPTSRYRSAFLYRGLSDSKYKLVTSLFRNCKGKQDVLEECILRNYTKYASINDEKLSTSIWRQLIIGQHHGLPTRLMDWSYSPLVGLHFALGDDLHNMESKDAAIWRIDINELNSLLPSEFHNTLVQTNAYLFTVDMMESLVKDLEAYDVAMQDKSLVLLEPPSIDQRIISQYSYFMVVPNKIIDVGMFLEEMTDKSACFIINKNIRWKLRDYLDTLNINERTLLPGLDGVSKWLTRHYFVK